MNAKCIFYQGVWLDPSSKAYEIYKLKGACPELNEVVKAALNKEKQYG